MSRVQVDRSRCSNIATYLSSVELPPDVEEANVTFDLPAPVIGNVYLVAVAISHQTTPVVGPSLQGRVNDVALRGWDYLRAALWAAVGKDQGLASPRRLSVMSKQELATILGTEEITVLERRAALIRDIGSRMVEAHWRFIDEMNLSAESYLDRADGRGLLSQLKTFTAYQDPIRKKSLYFLALMKNNGLWRYRDDANLGPPVDYHEVRGHLRVGTVRFGDPELERQVRDGEVVDGEADLAVRGAVYDAIMLVAKESRYSPSQLHYYFWNLFRSCCSRAVTHCSSCPPGCGLPDRYRSVFDRYGRVCSLRDYCMSCEKAPKLIEHQCDTEYY